MNKGCFTKKNAAEMGSKGGKKTKRKYGKEHFKQIRKLVGAHKRWKKV